MGEAGERLETLRLLSGYVHTHVLVTNVHHEIGMEILSRSDADALQRLGGGGNDWARGDAVRAFEFAKTFAAMGDNEEMPCHLGSAVKLGRAAAGGSFGITIWQRTRAWRIA